MLKKKPKPKLNSWKQLVIQLADQVERWAAEENWSTFRDEKLLAESRVGEYAVPVLRIRNPRGEVWLDPIGLDIVGADGRVDLQAWPSLNRVKLIRRGQKWKIISDANLPLRREWSRKTFIDLANDLAALHQ